MPNDQKENEECLQADMLGGPIRVLLGHKNGQITTHYSAAEIGELIDAVEKAS
jgi:hypothetical protein